MLSVQLHKLGKKFNREWVFKNLDYKISSGQKLVVLGGNGSGKSTLLQVISGFVTPNQGEIIYEMGPNRVEPDLLKNHVAFASPYLQLIEDFTLLETVEHVTKFKPLMYCISTADFIEKIELPHAKNKTIKQLSSGMKQRLKLGLAILSQTPLLLLDEPVSNLDQKAIDWYKTMIENYTKEKTVIVCSNAIKEEYFFCDTSLNVTDYKKT